jgi:hypothetical protein
MPKPLDHEELVNPPVDPQADYMARREQERLAQTERARQQFGRPVTPENEQEFQDYMRRAGIVRGEARGGLIHRAEGGPVGLPGAQAGFGSLKPVIEQAFKNLLAKNPVAVQPAKRT